MKGSLVSRNFPEMIGARKFDLLGFVIADKIAVQTIDSSPSIFWSTTEA